MNKSSFFIVFFLCVLFCARASLYALCNAQEAFPLQSVKSLENMSLAQRIEQEYHDTQHSRLSQTQRQYYVWFHRRHYYLLLISPQNPFTALETPAKLRIQIVKIIQNHKPKNWQDYIKNSPDDEHIEFTLDLKSHRWHSSEANPSVPFPLLADIMTQKLQAPDKYILTEEWLPPLPPYLASINNTNQWFVSSLTAREGKKEKKLYVYFLDYEQKNEVHVPLAMPIWIESRSLTHKDFFRLIESGWIE